jgi:hypothetical protein
LWLAGCFIVRGVSWEGLCGRSVREGEDILLSERNGGGKPGQWPCGLWKEKRARAGSRNGIQESLGFSKNIKKSGPLIIGVKGLDSSSLSSDSYFSSIYIINIRNTPLNNKKELILFPAKYFLFGSELTLWDSSCRETTGIKGLLFCYIHIQRLDKAYQSFPV